MAKYNRRNGSVSNIIRVKILDSTSTVGAGLTGLTSASSGLIISTIANNEATATAYTVAGSTIETITTLGTFAAPTATKCRFKEVDATNHKGVYEIQIADARFAVASAKSLVVSVLGATNMVQVDLEIDQQADANLVSILGTLLTETAGLLAAAFTKFFNKASPTGTINSLPDVVPAGVGGLLTAPTTANTGLADVTRLLGTAWLTPAVAGTPDVNAKQISGDGAAADALEAAFDGTVGAIPELGIVDRGTAQSATGTTLVLRAAAAFANDELIGATIVILSASAGAGQARQITDYVSSTDTATVDTWTTTPTGTIVYAIFGSAPAASAASIAAAVWAEVTRTLTAATNITSTGGTTVPQTGDAYARLGAPAAASVSADILVIDNLVDDLESRIGTPSNLGGGATVAANLSDIEAQTDDIGVAGVGLTAQPWNAAWDAEVQSEVQDAIEVNHLDHLLAADYDPASKPGVATALLNELIESDAGVSRYTVNALEQAPSGSGASAATIADAVWDETRTDHVAAGSFGQAAQAARSGTAQAGAAGTITLDAGASAVDDFHNNSLILITGGTGATQGRTIVDYVGSTKVATISPNWSTNPASDSVFLILPVGVVSALANDAIVAGSIANNALSRNKFASDTGIKSIQSSTAQSGAAGSITLDAGASAVDDFYNDTEVQITGGTGNGQVRHISDYVGSTKVATVKPNWATVPDGTSTFAVVYRTSAWDQVLADHLDSGSTGASLNSASSAGDPWGTALPGAYGAGTAGKIVGDNIDATIGSRATASALSTAQTAIDAIPTNAELATALDAALDAAVADSIPADGSRPSARQALYMLTQFMVERSVSSTTVTVKKPDGSTTLFTLTLGDATSPTSITRAS